MVGLTSKVSISVLATQQAPVLDQDEAKLYQILNPRAVDRRIQECSGRLLNACEACDEGNGGGFD